MAGCPPRPCFPGFCATDRLRGGFINQYGRLARIGTQFRASSNCRSVIFARASHRSNHHPWSRGRNDAPKTARFECNSVWRFGNMAGECRARLLSPADRTIYFPVIFGRRRCRRRTPAPPPFSSMNSTPAASKARRTAKSLAMVIDVSPSVSSARLIVASPKAASRASSAALHRRRARAARIWALFSGFGFIVDDIGIV
jgi:hypothetical protein